MPYASATSLTLSQNILTGNSLTFDVTNLRFGDVVIGTERLIVDGRTVPSIGASFQYGYETIIVTNYESDGWPAGASAEVTWEGRMVLNELDDHEARIAALEARTGG